MSEKYIDLADVIGDFFCVEPPTILAAYIRNALRWLDEHPDRVPGRTFTESTERDLYHAAQHGPHQFRDALIDHRIFVTPDPEPTNAEKWETFIRGTQFNVRGWTGFDATKQFAEILDKQGVKAPGGDE